MRALYKMLLVLAVAVALTQVFTARPSQITFVFAVLCALAGAFGLWADDPRSDVLRLTSDEFHEWMRELHDPEFRD